MSPTPDTQATLLLCARLGQREENAVKPLSPRQYAEIAIWLKDRSLRPGDLLRDAGRAQLADLPPEKFSKESVELLLDRGAALALVLERWTSQGLWVLGQGDPMYPARYTSYLERDAPPLLYGVGEQSFLDSGGLAIVGSREATEDELEFTRGVGAACAQQKIAVISGAAKGIDSESMMAAVDRGGKSLGVLAEGLGRAAVAGHYHDAILEGRLTLISPYDPDSHWFAFKAMERNKLIYGLADAALVVCASDEKGGTWAWRY